MKRTMTYSSSSWIPLLVLIVIPSSFGFTISPTKKLQFPCKTNIKILSISSSLIQRSAVQDDEDAEYVKVPRRRRRGGIDNDDDNEYEAGKEDDQNRNARDQFEEDLFEEEEEEEDDEFEEDDKYDLFSNVIIDNPLLDNMDPDGAAERFPELAKDPKFWIDITLFVLFLDWLSSIGPQDTIPEGFPFF